MNASCETTTTGRLVLLGALAETGAIRPVIDRRFPLAAAAEAIRYVGEGHARGKVVVEIDRGRPWADRILSRSRLSPRV